MVVAVLVVGGVVLAVMGTMVGMGLGSGLPGPALGPPPTVAPPPAPTTAPTTPTPTPTPGPTPTGPTATPTTDPHMTLAPDPRSGREVYADLPQVVANDFYDLAVTSLECPGLSLPVPEGKALEPWAAKAIGCLREHYEPLVRASGHTLTTPSLTFYTDSVDTPCGDGATGAFYCSADEGIYVQRGLYVAAAGRLNTIRMLLHEFSHHVQNRIGVLDSQIYGREPMPVISRRIELQASCWTGMQLRGSDWLRWDGSDEDWMRRFNSVDSDSRHGDAESRTYWYQRGRAGDTFEACNTWTADRDHVD